MQNFSLPQVPVPPQIWAPCTFKIEGAIDGCTQCDDNANDVDDDWWVWMSIISEDFNDSWTHRERKRERESYSGRVMRLISSSFVCRRRRHLQLWWFSWRRPGEICAGPWWLPWPWERSSVIGRGTSPSRVPYDRVVGEDCCCCCFFFWLKGKICHGP